MDLYIFVDAENLYGMGIAMGMKVDVIKLVSVIESLIPGKMKHGYYFMADRHQPILPEEDENSPLTQAYHNYQKQENFKRWLAKQGFRVISRKPQVMEDEKSGKYYYKANCDSMLATEMTALATEKFPFRNESAFVLVAGDSDYDYPLNKIIQSGFSVRVVSSERSLADNILYLLGGDRIISLEKIATQVERRERE